jgi:acyl-CoA synthetase (NDP forming)
VSVGLIALNRARVSKTAKLMPGGQNMPFERLLKPRTIAVFGGAQAQEVIRQSDRMGYKGEIWPVHPKKTEILGRKVFRSVEELPGSPDAAYVGVNRHLTIDIVRDLAARDSGGAICYATGFTEAGEEGSELEVRLLEASGDMPLIGPNCYGLLNYVEGAMLWPDQQGGRRVEEGIAIITMSSNVGFNLTMQRRGLPIAYMTSLGNMLKFDLHDAIHTFARQDRVTALGLYVETMPAPKAFEEAVNVARELAKPIVAIKTGRSEIARKMVISHTASLAGSDVLVSALFERLGVARVNSLEALMEALKVLHVLGPLNGGRIGAMSTSGGDLTLLADAMGPSLSMPQLSEKVTQHLRTTVHERVMPANPLDFMMFDWNDEDRMTEIFTAFLSEDFDVALCLLDYPREDLCDQSTWGGAERGFVRAAQQTGTKGAVLATFSDTISESVAARLMKDDIAMLAGIDAGLAGIQAAVNVGAAWSKPPSPPLLTSFGQRQDGPVKVMNEAESKKFLAKYGVPIPSARVVRSAGEAVEAADELGYPVVVKALDVTHKTEVGGVRLDLGSADEVSAAVNEMSGLSESYLIEKMVEGVVAELIVGVTRDEHFGPYLMVGGGGILVEMMKDTVSLLLPTTREHVLQALGQLRCAPLFTGFRGAPPTDLNAAVDVILVVAGMVEDAPSSIIELDINPLILLAEGQGVVAADALISMNAESTNDPGNVTESVRENTNE